MEILMYHSKLAHRIWLVLLIVLCCLFTQKNHAVAQPTTGCDKVPYEVSGGVEAGPPGYPLYILPQYAGHTNGRSISITGPTTGAIGIIASDPALLGVTIQLPCGKSIYLPIRYDGVVIEEHYCCTFTDGVIGTRVICYTLGIDYDSNGCPIIVVLL